MKIVVGKRLWAEDDATIGLDDHESLTEAWLDIIGVRLRDAKTLVCIDHDDSFDTVKQVGDKVFFIRSWFDGSEIYEATMETP